MYEVHALVTRISSPASLRGTGKIYDNFEFGDIIGKGRFGTVRLGYHKKSHVTYAIKTINKQKKGDEPLMNELEILNIISTKIGVHPCLCRTYEIYDDPFTTHVFI